MFNCREHACLVNKYVLLQVSAHYLTHDDTVAGVVNLIKKLKIKRIVIGSRSELNLNIKHHILKIKRSISSDLLLYV